MNIKLIVVGKLKEEYLRNKVSEYTKITNKNNNINIIELSDESIPRNSGEAINLMVKEKEGTRILEHINNSDYVIALCIEGKPTTSDELTNIVNKAANQVNGEIVFVVGGSLGLHDRVVKRANYKLSFSKMTFPHQLMRVMLLEQISSYL